MARSNVDAIFAENPFLSKIIPRSKVPNACVKRWSKEFLASTPDSYPESGSEKIYFVDEQGNKIARVGTRLEKFFTAIGFPTSETVAQSLSRLSDQEKQRIKFAVGVWHTITVWKLPNGYSNVAEWLKS